MCSYFFITLKLASLKQNTTQEYVFDNIKAKKTLA